MNTTNLARLVLAMNAAGCNFNQIVAVATEFDSAPVPVADVEPGPAWIEHTTGSQRPVSPDVLVDVKNDAHERPWNRLPVADVEPAWIEHTAGSQCPVSPDTSIRIRLKDGSEWASGFAARNVFDWSFVTHYAIV